MRLSNSTALAAVHESTLGRYRDKADVESRRRFYGYTALASTTLAESICASVFQGVVFGKMGTAETAAEG